MPAQPTPFLQQYGQQIGIPRLTHDCTYLLSNSIACLCSTFAQVIMQSSTFHSDNFIPTPKLATCMSWAALNGTKCGQHREVSIIINCHCTAFSEKNLTVDWIFNKDFPTWCVRKSLTTKKHLCHVCPLCVQYDRIRLSPHGFPSKMILRIFIKNCDIQLQFLLQIGQKLYTLHFLHLHLHFYVYIYIYIFTFTFTFYIYILHLHFCIYIYIYIYIFTFTFTFTFFAFTFTFLHLHLHFCIYIYFFTFTFLHLLSYIYIHFLHRHYHS